MKAQELSQKYAAAVFGLALEKWLTSLEAVQTRLADDSQRAKTLQDTDRTFADRQKALDGIIPAESDQNVRNFLYTLLKNGDLALLGDILENLEQMSRSGPQGQIAYVTTAVALTGNKKEDFRQKLRAEYGTYLELTFRVDPAIIGGAIIQVGDKIIDGSVATRLAAMSNTLGVKR